MTLTVEIKILDEANEGNRDKYISLINNIDCRPLVVRVGDEPLRFNIWKDKVFTLREENIPIIDVS